MGHRLSAIATRTGDEGHTGLGDGSRVSKGDPRVAAMGEVDELNSALGLLLAFGLTEDALGTRQLLLRTQHDLLDLGGELSIPGHSLLKPERVAALDSWLAQANAGLPRLQEFVVPGGSVLAGQAHMVRTICRRAERAVVVLAESQAVGRHARPYLNRLSDVMFVLARLLNSGLSEIQWDRAPRS